MQKNTANLSKNKKWSIMTTLYNSEKKRFRLMYLFFYLLVSICCLFCCYFDCKDTNNFLFGKIIFSG